MRGSGALPALAITFAAAIQARPHESDKRFIERRIGALIRSHPDVQHGHVGFKFVDVETGNTLAEQSAQNSFIPASNAKLYTTALALARLGANYAFETRVSTKCNPVSGDTTITDLELVGGGDPNLSGRVLPYQKGSHDGDPYAALTDLATKIASAGVRQIAGDVTGVASRYGNEGYPEGWTIDDSIYANGAPVSAITFNDSAENLSVRPSQVGDLAEIEIRPAPEHFIVLNEVMTDDSGEAKVHLTRAAETNEIVLTGSIGAHVDKEWSTDIAVIDPALFAAEAFVQALRGAGIAVLGSARSNYEHEDDAAAHTIAIHKSGPLWQDLQVTNKISHNLHAEMLLREVAFKGTGAGTMEAALSERQKFLREAGVSNGEFGPALADGSGLARQDLTTPDFTVRLLRFMWNRPDRDLWVRTLPIGGVDGSLEKRFRGIAHADRIHAKTGSISHVATLSGYIESARGKWRAFSVMVNGTSGHEAEVREFIDRLCALFLE